MPITEILVQEIHNDGTVAQCVIPVGQADDVAEVMLALHDNETYCVSVGILASFVLLPVVSDVDPATYRPPQARNF